MLWFHMARSENPWGPAIPAQGLQGTLQITRKTVAQGFALRRGQGNHCISDDFHSEIHLLGSDSSSAKLTNFSTQKVQPDLVISGFYTYRVFEGWQGKRPGYPRDRQT